MVAKIKDALKNKYKDLGFTEKTFEGVATYLATTVTKDEDIETAIAGVEALLKSFQSDFDKLRTENAALKKPKPAADPKKEDAEPKTEPAAGENAELSELKTLVKGLGDQLKAIAGEKTDTSFKSKLKEGLKDVPESFYAHALVGRTFTKEEEVTELTEAIKTGYEKHKQDTADSGLSAFPKPAKSTGKTDDKQATKEEAEAVVNAILP